MGGGGVSNFTSSKRAPEKPTQIRVNIFHNFIPNKNIICNDKDPPNQNTDWEEKSSFEDFH